MSMKFRFKIQQYQTDAVESVVNVFLGQPKQDVFTYQRDLGKSKLVSIETADVIGYSNYPISLGNDELLKNLNNIQTRFNLPLSDHLTQINGLGSVSLDVEMETGTGKTYVYIKTMFELNKQYGWSKFIVVVPSIAIREGVRKSFQITEDHFMGIYGKKARYFIYDSKHLTELDEFSRTNNLSVMIINIQAFNKSFKEGKKDSLIIYSARDEFGGRKPIDVVSKNRPIIILDEPQKMGGDATQKALCNFNPLFTINYSATHKVHHDLVYVLDALDAYNQKLVKKIEVKGFTVRNLKGTNSYLYVQNILVSPDKPPKALIEIEVGYNKSVNRETRYFNVGDSIYEASKHMNQYQTGYMITDINALNGTVTLSSGNIIKIGEATGDATEKDIVRIQIRETIKSHLKKEQELYKLGIKVLSLFFIDEVAKYRQYDEEGNQLLGEYGQIFEEEYKNEVMCQKTLLTPDYNNYLDDIAVAETHRGYFSIDKGKMVNSKVSRGSDISDDVSAYDLILKDKERLLSFDEPTRFIFSHSALREGWDNPNVFQICTLKHSSSDVQRHQEVGRGLRLCVNQLGERIDSSVQGLDSRDINRLTVIANESYESFVVGLQSQIKENLFDRPKKISRDFFYGKNLTSTTTNDIKKLTSNESLDIRDFLLANQYIDITGEITNKYVEDRNNNSIPLISTVIPSLAGYEESIFTILDNIKAGRNEIEIVNANVAQISENKLNSNFNKKEFQELWKSINHKYAYTVQFDSNELIKNAINAINTELNITKLMYTVSTGEQKDNISRAAIDNNMSFTNASTKTLAVDTGINSTVKYDLIGKIREKTQLTRKTIASILKNINDDKFYMFKLNPEEFINKTSKIINEQKATMIVEHVQYKQTDDVGFDTNIFTQSKSKSDFINAFKATKSIQDYVFTDGVVNNSVERKFAESLDNADEVIVYAKLPTKFYIPTPVGNYSPDWAIAFKSGNIKHVYFIAETKGSMNSLQLRAIEKAKIECADKLFNHLKNAKVGYGKVSSYSELIDILKV